MRADHIIKFSKDHPMMAPKLKAIRLVGGINASSNGINYENILKGVINIRNWTGQMPKVVKAQKSVAGFKLRKGTDIVILSTLRNVNTLDKFYKYLVYTTIDNNNHFNLNNNSIYLGIPNVKLLNNAGVNVNFILNGNVTEGRGAYFRSTLLIPRGAPQGVPQRGVYTL